MGSETTDDGGKTCVVVFGLPRYTDARDRSFTMERGYVPNDAFITCSSAKSVFGTSDRKDRLNGVSVHWAYVTDGFVNEMERRALARFWSCYCSELGATLASFSPSTELVLDRVKAGASDPAVPGATIDRTVKEFVMLRFGGETPKVSKPVPAVKPKQLRYVQASPATSKPVKLTPQVKEAVEAAAKEIAPPPKGFAQIAAFWLGDPSQQIDVDLRVRASPKAEVLYFGRKKTAEGRHLGDVTVAQKPGSSWKATAEIIEVQDAALETLRCTVNLYQNSSGKPVVGTVRLVLRDRAVDVPFRLEGQGDKGSGKAPGCWQVIDLLKAWQR